MPRTAKTKPTTKVLTIAEYRRMLEEDGGICLNCLQEVYGIEPDYRHGTCENCGANTVYGIEELLIMGKIEVIE